MKKHLKPDLLPLIVLAFGIIGLLLKLWQAMAGTDEKGLLITGHISGILLAILSVVILVVLALGTFALTQGNNYRRNFPASLPACVCTGLAAIGVLLTALSYLRDPKDVVSLITGIFALLATVCLGFLSYGRLRGQQPSLLLHICVCIFMMLHLISQYRVFSSEPQVQSYCYPLLATVCIMLACYQSATFAGNCGIRQAHTFFHLAAVYFCCLSLIGDHTPLFYLVMGAWMITDLCSLRPAPRRFARGNDL